MTDWNRRWLELAGYVALKYSKDPNTKVGSVVVGITPNLVAFGWNGFPPKVEDKTERLFDRDLKNKLTVHAEVNAINNAVFDPYYLYSTHFPCVACTLFTIARRTVREVYAPAPTGEYLERWGKDVDMSLALFQEAGIRAVLMDV